jgi:hypothetical protein
MTWYILRSKRVALGPGLSFLFTIHELPLNEEASDVGVPREQMITGAGYRHFTAPDLELRVLGVCIGGKIVVL